MAQYDFASTGIQINGKDSYHVVKVQDTDEWLLLRMRNGTHYQAGKFVSPDEARAFVHALDLDLNKL
jgi:hypothetical protein